MRRGGNASDTSTESWPPRHSQLHGSAVAMPPLVDTPLKCFAIEQVGPRPGGRSNSLIRAFRSSRGRHGDLHRLTIRKGQ